jgi:hypothetical protein
MATRKKSSKKSSGKPARKASQASVTTQQTIDQHPRPVQQAPETTNVIPVGTGIDQHPRPVHQMEFRAGPPVAKKAAATGPACSLTLITETGNNGDEEDFSNFIGNYHKGLHHDNFGEVVPADYQKLRHATTKNNPSQADFANIPITNDLGPMFGRKYTNPQAGLATDLEGPDPKKMKMRQAPKVNSDETAAEAVELYWMALLRDVPFTQFDTNPQVAMAASELAGLSEFTGKVNNTVTPQTIFRGCEAGNLQGPFISQFLFKDIPYGALYGSLIPPQPQKMRTVLGEAAVGVGNADYMTTVQDWLDVQNGKMIFPFDMYDSTPRYIRNMRDLGEYVHVDALYEAYLNACLILLGMMASVDMGNPYRPPNTASTNQIGFGTFGGPHILSLVTEVATRALKVVWYQKWQMHRRLRPEAYGGLVHFKKTGQKPIYPIPPQVLGSQAVAQTQAKFGTYLLPMEFQEGSPTHPSYGAGHATVAGACVTVLKAFFDENAPMPSPVVPTPDGLTLLPYTGSDAGSLTVGGELNKVAANIAIGRNMAGVHWRSDYYQSLRLGERVAICILYNQRKDYHEDYSFTFTSFDGETVTISRNGVDGLDDFRPCRDKG